MTTTIVHDSMSSHSILQFNILTILSLPLLFSLAYQCNASDTIRSALNRNKRENKIEDDEEKKNESLKAIFIFQMPQMSILWIRNCGVYTEHCTRHYSYNKNRAQCVQCAHTNEFRTQPYV